jgi:F0F1-type ATP synthase assembly protein I
MQEILGYASGILIGVSAIPYIRDIFLFKTKPERMTWFLWSVLLAIAFFAQISKGGTWSLITTGVDFLGVIIIFILSLKYGMGGMKKLDIVALIGAMIGLVLWYITDEALTALLITIFIDFLAGMLTIVKTYKEPHTETMKAYVICGTGGLLGALSVGEFNFSLIIFPLWICILNYTIAITVVLGKRKIA